MDYRRMFVAELPYQISADINQGPSVPKHKIIWSQDPLDLIEGVGMISSRMLDIAWEVLVSAITEVYQEHRSTERRARSGQGSSLGLLETHEQHVRTRMRRREEDGDLQIKGKVDNTTHYLAKRLT